MGVHDLVFVHVRDLTALLDCISIICTAVKILVVDLDVCEHRLELLDLQRASRLRVKFLILVSLARTVRITHLLIRIYGLVRVLKLGYLTLKLRKKNGRLLAIQ